MNLQLYKLSYISDVQIIQKDIKIKNKSENTKITHIILILEISKLRNIGRSTFGRSKF